MVSLRWGLHRIVVVLSFLLGLGSSSAWSTTDCMKIQLQLEEMQKAQASLLESMVKKNDSLAGTLDQFADDLKSHEDRPTQVDIINLRNSATAFRGHSDREMILIGKFQKKSKELIGQTVECLSQNGTKGKLHQPSSQASAQLH